MARGESVSAPSLSMALGQPVAGSHRYSYDRAERSMDALSGAEAVARSKEANELRRAAPGATEEGAKQLLAERPPASPARPIAGAAGSARGGYGGGGMMGGMGGYDGSGMGGYGFAAAASTQPAGEVGVGEAGVRYVGSRTFYRDGEKWVDSKYESKQETTKVKLFSDDYFNLLKKHADAAKYFALGKYVVVILDGKAYETVE